MRVLRIRIDGMHCTGCTEIVRHVLGQEAGVQGCAVSLDERLARVAIDPDRTSGERLVAALDRAGFPAELPN